MPPPSPLPIDTPTVGLIGFGAFGRLIARHLARHVRVLAHDPFVAPDAFGPDAEPADLATAAACPVLILATPVPTLREVVRALAPHPEPGVLAVDVGSVRMTTRSFERIMEAVGMVRHDAPEVFCAIERENPFAPAVRRRFFELAAEPGAEPDAERSAARPHLALVR